MTLRAARFAAPFLDELPVDPVRDNRRRQVYEAVASRVEPTPVSDPRIRAWIPEVAALLGLPDDPDGDPELAQLFGGSLVLPGMQTYAAAYGGHQFGNWAGQLGDGRAISLGELEGPDGRTWELQLKGAGPTPYSRTADGRAVLRSSLRELVCSEAMFHLGVPTTRALSLVTSGEQVVRDMLYDGHPRPEPGAIVCRVAPSFLRFGNYELFASRKDSGTLRKLVDYTLARFYPELVIDDDPDGTLVAWVGEVARRTAVMIDHWMRVGFVHGVMNTDNMSILGLTIDYGPYGFIDDFDPDFTPNTTDLPGRRYRFGHQPRVAGWNLTRLAMAVAPLMQEVERLNEGLARYGETLGEASSKTYAAKLGLEMLRDADDEEDPNGDPWLVDELHALLTAVPTDATIFFRRLADVPLAEQSSDDALIEPLAQAYYDDLRPEHAARTTAWLRRLTARAREDAVDPEQRRARMLATSPMYIPRNYLAQQAIDAAEGGDFDELHLLLEVMRSPYEERAEWARFAEKRPAWAKHKVGCSMLSCSS